MKCTPEHTPLQISEYATGMKYYAWAVNLFSYFSMFCKKREIFCLLWGKEEITEKGNREMGERKGRDLSNGYKPPKFLEPAPPITVTSSKYRTSCPLLDVLFLVIVEVKRRPT